MQVLWITHERVHFRFKILASERAVEAPCESDRAPHFREKLELISDCIILAGLFDLAARRIIAEKRMHFSYREELIWRHAVWATFVSQLSKDILLDKLDWLTIARVDKWINLLDLVVAYLYRKSNGWSCEVSWVYLVKSVMYAFRK